MIVDTHMHTEFSFDSSEKIERMLEKAKELHMGITTTEHKDLNYEEVGGFPIDFDVDHYFKTYEKYRSDTYFMGIELGLDRNYTKELEHLTSQYPFDMVIGSLHTMKGFNLSSRKYLAKMEEEVFYKEYLHYAKEMVEEHPFIDALAHFDYPTRYSPYREMRYEAYQEDFDGLFQAMVKHQVTLELNLKRPLQGELYHAFKSVYGGYKSQGGQFVTLASDAHVAEDIGRNFHEAKSLLDELGLEICYYRNRERICQGSSLV